MSCADVVRAFYDRYPYPPPVVNLDQYGRGWDEPRRRADHHLFWPHRAYRADVSILVAGCGTSQAVKHAMRWPEARVTGIDISATSLRCTEELIRKHGVSNLEVRELPVERAAELGASFDQIVCTGVLHHLEDPDAGLRALTGALKPDGAMHLMVYAPYGRTGVYMLQEFCRRVGIGATDDGIRDLAGALRALPPGHPLEHLLHEAPDFGQKEGLADALLHPRDRAYSVPQLFEFLGNAGLAFGRWVKQAPYLPQCGAMTRIPSACRLSELPPMEQYAAIELFRGTMVRHSVIAHRTDGPAPPWHVEFSGEEWPAYVPLRAPDTLTIEERLPRGAAAVLINPTHTYRDLLLPIDREEKTMLDAIDGCRTIGEIAGSGLVRARAFFERLWRYDQAVFDASRVNT